MNVYNLYMRSKLKGYQRTRSSIVATMRELKRIVLGELLDLEEVLE